MGAWLPSNDCWHGVGDKDDMGDETGVKDEIGQEFCYRNDTDDEDDDRDNFSDEVGAIGMVLLIQIVVVARIVIRIMLVMGMLIGIILVMRKVIGRANTDNDGDRNGIDDGKYSNKDTGCLLRFS